MNWDAIGAVSESIAAIAVVATLIHPVEQIPPRHVEPHTNRRGQKNHRSR